jgi:pimeloyl-ACP methyl ester carboxylesterase
MRPAWIAPDQLARTRGGDLLRTDSGSGDPILLIHGSGFDLCTWGRTYDELAQDHRVVAYNRRGYRGSGAETRRWADHTEDAAALLRSLDASPATVVAHSAGAIVALELAIRRPELVAALILLDPAVYVCRYATPDFAWAFVTSQAVRRLRGDERGAERFLRWATRYRDGGSAWERGDFPQQWREAMLGGASAAFADMAAGDGSHIARGDVSSIKPAVTIIAGGRSPSLYRRITAGLSSLFSTPPDESSLKVPDTMAFDEPVELARLIRVAARRGIESRQSNS